MAVDMQKTLVAVGVGVLDEVVEAVDETAGRTEPFRRWTDFVRLIAAGTGYAMQVFGVRGWERAAEGLALSATPLLVKSVGKPVRQALRERAGGFTPRRSGTGTAPTLRSGAVSRYPAPAYESEFEGVRLR